MNFNVMLPTAGGGRESSRAVSPLSSGMPVAPDS